VTDFVHPFYGPVKVFDETDDISRIVLSGSEWEPRIADLIHAEVRDGTDVLDIGANLGFSTLGLLKRGCRPAAVHCFEPQPDVHALLQYNVQSYPNVKTYNLALGSRVAEVHGYTQAQTNVGGTYLDSGNRHFVLSTSLDTLLERGLFRQPISLIKIDVEGFEQALFEGAQEFFQRHRPVIIIESWQNKIEKVTQQLDALGYVRASHISYDDYIFRPVARSVSKAVARTITAHEAVRGSSYFEQVVETTNYGARLDVLRQWATGRKVLHIGCTDYPIFNPDCNLHLQIAPVTKELVGLDVDKDGLEQLRKHHPGRYYTNAAELADETFDLVLMPETIEHIGDPAQALKQLLATIKFKEFVITAPSYRYWAGQARYANGRFYETVHPDHYAWYSPATLRRLLRDVVDPRDQIEFFFLDEQRAVGARIVRSQPSPSLSDTQVKKLTLVTGLFDLAARDGTNRRSADEYLQLGSFVFALDQDIIFFADPPLAAKIRAQRQLHGKLDRTTIVPISFEDLTCQHLKSAVEQTRSPQNLNAEKDTVNYTLLGWSKFELLDRAITYDPFGASHFAWIDLGIAHVVDTGGPASVEPFEDPSDLVKLHMLRYFSADTVRVPEYWQQLQQNVAGGFFVGSKANMKDLTTAFWRAIDLAIGQGCRPLELDVLPYLAVQEPERFAFSYGDYPDILRNHTRVRRNGGHLLWIMRAAREHKAWQLGGAIGQLALDGYKAGTFDLAPDVVEKFAIEYYLATYYREYPQQDAAHAIAEYYAYLAYINPQFREAFRQREQFVRDSFAYLTQHVLLP
jgi:FkbM family methyltransferase